MTECNLDTRLILKIFLEFLERNPENYDVAFIIGPNWVVVRALKILLKAASSTLETKFLRDWNSSVIKEEVILSTFDSQAFQLFIKMTMSNAWSMKSLHSFVTPSEKMLSLLYIFRQFGMNAAAEKLNKILKIYFRRLDRELRSYRNEILNKPEVKLHTLIQHNINEQSLFKFAFRWAEFQCREKGVDLTAVNVRDVLGYSVFKKIFPLLLKFDFFKKFIGLINLLKGTDPYKTYQFLAAQLTNTDTSCLQLDTTTQQVPIKVQDEPDARQLNPNSTLILPSPALGEPKLEPTQSVPDPQPNTGQQKIMMPPLRPIGTATAPLNCLKPQNQNEWKVRSLLELPEVINCPLPIGLETLGLATYEWLFPYFTCDGRWFHVEIQALQKVQLLGLGFCGPMTGDAFYFVAVETVLVVDGRRSFTNGTEMKRVFASKGRLIRFLFNIPVTLCPNPFIDRRENLGTRCFIRFSLEGPDTYTRKIVTQFMTSASLKVVGSCQVAEIYFRKV